VRLCIVSLHYAPEVTGNAPYVTGLAEHLVSCGHEVTVITGFPNYPQGRVHARYRGRLQQRETIRGVDVRRRGHHVTSGRSAIGRALCEGTFALSGLSAMGIPRPDAVLGVVPSLSGGLLARSVAWRFGVPYGLIFQDLMGRAAAQSGVSPAWQAVRGLRAAERWSARGAAAIGVIAEGFRPYLEALGVDPARIRRVRNWTHLAEPTLDRAAARERIGLPQDAIVCLHTGNMGLKQGLENVVECARLSAASDRALLFVLVGDGNQRPYLEALARRYSLPNLRLLPVQPAELYPSMLAAADILLVNQRGSVVDMSLPSKLTSYFAAGRPVVAAVAAASETAHELEASGGGLVVAPDEPRVLLEALESLADNSVRCSELGESGRSWAVSTLSKEAAMETYDGLLAAVLAASSTAERAVDGNTSTSLTLPNQKEPTLGRR
jgi:glycosyltransferase involved in cell wall biosynthesis